MDKNNRKCDICKNKDACMVCELVELLNSVKEDYHKSKKKSKIATEARTVKLEVNHG